MSRHDWSQSDVVAVRVALVDALAAKSYASTETSWEEPQLSDGIVNVVPATSLDETSS